MLLCWSSNTLETGFRVVRSCSLWHICLLSFLMTQLHFQSQTDKNDESPTEQPKFSSCVLLSPAPPRGNSYVQQMVPRINPVVEITKPLIFGESGYLRSPIPPHSVSISNGTCLWTSFDPICVHVEDHWRCCRCSAGFGH